MSRAWLINCCSIFGKDSGLPGDTDNLIVGDVVYVNGDPNKRGKIVYIGEVAFAKGEFVGITLDKPIGMKGNVNKVKVDWEMKDKICSLH